jgi:hypothetical protein
MATLKRAKRQLEEADRPKSACAGFVSRGSRSGGVEDGDESRVSLENTDPFRFC